MTAAPLPWAANPFVSTEFLLTVGLLIAVLLTGAVVLFFVDRWRKRQLADHDSESVESLSSFRALYERGELTEAEYKAVRDKMARKVKQEVAAANPATVAQPPPGPAAPGGGESPAGPDVPPQVEPPTA
jgi:hypothetical protein